MTGVPDGERPLRIWVVAGEYPSPSAPHRGNFVAAQVVALRAAGHEVEVVTSLPPSLRPLANALLPRVRAWGALGRRSLGRRGSARGDHSVVDAASPGVTPPASTDSPGPASDAPVRPGRGAQLVRRGVRVGRVVHDGTGTAIAAARMVRRLERLARLHGRPDVVHAHNVFPAGVAARRFAARAGVPYVVTEHMSGYLRGQYSPGEIRRAAGVLAQAGAVIAVSSVQAEALPVPTARVTVVPNVVLTEDFRARDAQARESGAVLSIGLLASHKRMDLLLRSYAALPAEVRAAHPLRVVGAGPERTRLAALAEALGLGQEVLVGRRTRAQVVDELAGAAVLVSTSVVETFGLTLIEALAAGVPFVATDSGGPRDIWAPGLGVLVDSDRPDVFAAALTQIVGTTASETDDEERRRAARDRFGPAAVADRLTEVYRRLAP